MFYLCRTRFWSISCLRIGVWPQTARSVLKGLVLKQDEMRWNEATQKNKLASLMHGIYMHLISALPSLTNQALAPTSWESAWFQKLPFGSSSTIYLPLDGTAVPRCKTSFLLHELIRFNCLTVWLWETQTCCYLQQDLCSRKQKHIKWGKSADRKRMWQTLVFNLKVTSNKSHKNRRLFCCFASTSTN